jgi:hypothetical protein
MAGAFRAALPPSSRRGRVSRAGYGRATDHVHLKRLAEFQERDIGGTWLPRQVRRGDIFVTGSKTPYELRWRSPLGAEMDVIHIHLAVDQCLAAFEMVYHDKAGAVQVTDFYGRDETLAHLSFACADMLSARTAGNAKRVAAFAHLLAIHIAEKYTNIASQRPDYRGGLPIARLRKIEDYVRRTSQKAFQSRRWLSRCEEWPGHLAKIEKDDTPVAVPDRTHRGPRL